MISKAMSAADRTLKDNSPIAREASAALRPDHVLDTLGLYCPLPMIKTAELMKRMRLGEILEVLSDDRAILIDIPAWCASSGNQFIGSRQSDDEVHLYIRKMRESE